MSSISFVQRPQINESTNSVLIICGRTDILKEKSQTLLSKMGVEITPSLLNGLLNGSCSSFSGSTSTTLLPGKDSENYLRLSFLKTPNVFSRHNCPTRPDVVYEKLPSLLNNENQSSGDECSSTPITIVFVLPNDSPYTEKESALSFAGALGRACPLYSRKKKSSTSISITSGFFSSSNDTFCFENDENFINSISISTQSVREAAALVDQPCNEMHVTAMVKEANDAISKLSEDGNCKGKVTMHKCCIGKDLEAEGFGGIYGVGKAAANPPALVVLKYEPEGESDETIAWVGKGIVYDTGGLSMKTKTTMPGMKRDMGGSAAILKAFVAAAAIGCSKTIYAVLCLAENAVGPDATRPDDIHTLYSGVTVEINNTDAEGRLVVGDGVAYVSKHLNVDVILDMCTLTGAQGIATGQRHASIVCNDDSIEQNAVIAGRKSGDMCHPMPYCPELFTVEFKR